MIRKHREYTKMLFLETFITRTKKAKYITYLSVTLTYEPEGRVET